MSSDFNFYINRQGARGRQGEQGEQGFSPVITVNTDTAREYKLNIETENNLIVTPNLKGNPLSVIQGAGKYVLFDEVNNTIYNSAKPSELVDTEMFASTSDAGIIRIADDSDITDKATDAAVTPKQLADAINEVESTIPADTVTHTELTSAINGVTSQIPGIATSETAGIIKPDGITTTVSEGGILTAIQSAPTNVVTTNTAQSVTGNKTFNIIGLQADNNTGIIRAVHENGSTNFITAFFDSANQQYTLSVPSMTTIKSALGVIGKTTIEASEFVRYKSSVDYPIVDTSMLDNTTITYDDTTGKISSISSAPTVIDGGEEVVDISGIFSLSKYYEDTSYTGNEQDFFNGNGTIKFAKGTNNVGLIISANNWSLFSNISFDATRTFIQVVDSNNNLIWGSGGSYSTGTKTIPVSSLTGISKVLIFSDATTGTLSNFNYNLV